jgi:hypothetical protein
MQAGQTRGIAADAPTGSAPWPETPCFPGCWPLPDLLACDKTNADRPS